MFRAAGVVGRVVGRSGNRFHILSRICVYRTTTAVVHKKPLEVTLPSNAVVVGAVEKLGLRRYLDIYRLNAILLDPGEKSSDFAYLWGLVLSQRDVSLVNKYLFLRLDCGVKFDASQLLKSLEEAGLRPNVRTFGAFVRQSCSTGDMEQTSVYLQALKQANLKPDLYIFSQILHGYLKAGCPEEVASTKDIMTRMNLWPSRLGYEGMLSAYAELGDRAGLLQTLNEAWEYLVSQSKSTSTPSEHFLPTFIIQLYVKLICAEPQPDGTCAELSTRLPIPVDPITRSRAREATKRLLANGRLLAAQELFKRADPEGADDSYLISLSKYIAAGGIDPQAVSSFWELSEVTGPRLSMLRRKLSSNIRRQSVKAAPSFDALRAAFSNKDVEGAFDLIKKQNPSGSMIYNYVVPQLLRLGLTPLDLVNRLEPAKLHPVAAFGCLLAGLSPNREHGSQSEIQWDTMEIMLSSFMNDGYFPVDEYIQFSTPTIRQMVAATSLVPDSSENQLARALEFIDKAISPTQLRAVICQLFDHCLYPFSVGSRSGTREPTSRDHHALRSLVDACLLKDIRFSSNHWIFYSLQDCGFPQEKIDQLKLPQVTDQRPVQDRSKRMSMWKRLHGWLKDGDVDSSVKAIKQAAIRHEGLHPSVALRAVADIRFPDTVAIACELLQETRDRCDSLESISYPISAQDVERLFWASWDSQLLPNPLRAITQVASVYNKMSDFKGMAEYFGRATKQLGSMQDALLTPPYMHALLVDNFSENLSLLQTMICSSYISTAMFAKCTCLLEDMLFTKFSDKLNDLPDFQRGSKDYWPVQALSKRFHGMSHLQKLRTIHNAVDDLCKSNNLYAAHSLRIWANQLGLLIFPKTNETLVFTPYMNPSYQRQSSLPSWSMSHELSQHFPANLDHRLLTALDSLVTEPPPASDSTSNVAASVQAVVTFLVDHMPLDHVQLDSSSSSNWLPTWLVVCQRLHQTGSRFTNPQLYASLVTEYVKQRPNADSKLVVELDHWFTYAPTVHHKAAVVLGALACPTSQTWGIERLRANEDLLYTIAVKLNPSSILSPDQQILYTDAITQLGRLHTMDLVDPLRQVPLNLSELKLASQKFTPDELCKQLATYVLSTDAPLKPIVEYIQEADRNLLIPFFDHLLCNLRDLPGRLRLGRFCHELIQQLSVDVTSLKAENRAFLYAVNRVLNAPLSELVDPLECLKQALPEELRDSWFCETRSAIAGEDFISLYELINRLDPSMRKSALSFVAYILAGTGDTTRVKKLLTTIAEHSDGPLLRYAVEAARPFLLGGLDDTYLALSRFYNNEKTDWFDRACIRYHKFGPLLQRRAPTRTLGVNVRDQTDAVDELTSLLRQPISSVVQTILSIKSDYEKVKSSLPHLLSGWSSQRKAILLSYLIAEGATDAVTCVLDSGVNVFKVKDRAPFVEFAQIVGSFLANPRGTTPELTNSAQSALLRLNKLEPKEVNACLRGPHVELLFRAWPSEKLSDLLQIVNNASEHERTSLNLHLAAIMINRNCYDLVKRMIKTSGPIPTTFLAGSPRHILSGPELEATLVYLSENDPNHIPAFIDTCLRNAVSTTNRRQTSDLVNFVRTVTSQPNAFNLPKICLLPTVNLIADYLNRISKLPADVEDILKSVVDHFNESHQRSNSS